MFELVVYALVAPFGLLLLSSIWVYPAVLEEVVKWAVLKFGTIQRIGFREGAAVGLAFGISEAILYSLNAWTVGEWGVIGLRLILTVPMHLVTAGIIGSLMKRGYGYFGVLTAMVIHAGFNYTVGFIA